MRSEVEEESCEEEEQGGWAADDMFGEREREKIADTSMEAPPLRSNHPYEPAYSSLFFIL